MISRCEQPWRAQEIKYTHRKVMMLLVRSPCTPYGNGFPLALLAVAEFFFGEKIHSLGGRIDEIDEDCLSAASVGSVGFLVLTSFF